MNVNSEETKSSTKPTEPDKDTDPDESEAESNDDAEGDEKDGEENQESDSSGSCSDSSDSNEKCPICLLSFHEQEIGSPNVCEHAFCVPCIEVWSRSVKTCPIDRMSFTSINVHQSFDVRKLLRSIAVDTNSNKELILADEEEEDATLCEMCRRSDREDVMLLCDGCNRGYHIDCLTPALEEIPHGSWYCDNCFSSHSSSESDEGEIDDLLNELEDVGGHLVELGRMRHQPRITRTRQSERIRNTILTTTGRRTQTTASIIRPQPSTSRSITASTSRTASTTTKPRVVRKKRRKKYRRRTRTVVVEYDLNSDSKFPIATKKVKITRRRKKRKVKRKTKKTSTRRTTGVPSASSVSTKNNLEHGMCGRRSSRSILPNFNLMGPKRDMDVLFSDGDGDDDAHDAYTRAIASGSTGMMLSIRNSSHSRNIIGNKNSITARISASSNSAMPNLLDSIMQSQEIWHSRDGMNKVVIGKAGNISMKKKRPESTKTASEIITNSAATTTGGETSSTSPVKESQSAPDSTKNNAQEPNSSSVKDEDDLPSKSSDPAQSSSTQEPNGFSESIKNEKHDSDDTPPKSPKAEEKEVVKKEEKCTPTAENEAKDTHKAEVVDQKPSASLLDLPTIESLRKETVSLPTIPASVIKTGFQYDDDDSDDGCPNFSVYSEETMALLARPADTEQSPEGGQDENSRISVNKEAEPSAEQTEAARQDFDEDLVQMSDNDENLQDAGDMVAVNGALEPTVEASPIVESVNDRPMTPECEPYDEPNTPTLDERYPEDSIKSPDDEHRMQLSTIAEDFENESIKSPDVNESTETEPKTPPLHPNQFVRSTVENEIQSPDQETVYDSSEDRVPREPSHEPARKSRRRRSTTEEEENDDDDEEEEEEEVPKKRKKQDHRKKSKKEHRKRSRSRSRRRKKSRDRDKKRSHRSPRSESRSPPPAHKEYTVKRSDGPRSQRDPKSHHSRKIKPTRSRSRSRSLSHRWSPVKRFSRSPSRSFTPPFTTSAHHSKKERKEKNGASTKVSKRSNSTKTKNKDVFKSGKNILVSVNFEKTKNSSKFEYSHDPIAIIDLTNGIKETIPSAKNIILVSDSEQEEDKMPDNSLIGAVKATIESKLKATAPPKSKPQPVAAPQQLESQKAAKGGEKAAKGGDQQSQTDRLLTQIKSALVDSGKRGGASIIPEKVSKTVAATSSGYDYLPYSPGSSDFEDLYDDNNADALSNGSPMHIPKQMQPSTSKVAEKGKRVFNDLFGQSPSDDDEAGTSKNPKARKPGGKKGTTYNNKLGIQKRAVTEAKIYLKPFFNSKQITKDEYKDILRRAVPKICRGGEIRPQKIESLIAAYVLTVRHQSTKFGKASRK